ncbi:MAG: phytanoyl-CoA dioxygenase family protein [Pseudomonadota bacterium]|nr:phytanoyl-CoA dioxygenase family protein [Pseudomonadota bacterium]
MLLPTEAESYQRDGYVIPSKFRLADSDLMELREAVNAILVGNPDVILWLTHLFCKLPRTAREVPWHQDGQYWLIWSWATRTVWIAIDKVDRNNGAMRVIPGSQSSREWRHHEEAGGHLTLNQAISNDQLSGKNVRYIELEPGQCSLHDFGIVHGSAANISGRIRAGLAIRYMPATSGLHRDCDLPVAKFDWSTLPIDLVRGENRNPVNDLGIGHDCLDW